MERHRRGRGTVFGECIASEQGETTFLRSDHLMTSFISHRYSQRWIFMGTRSAMKEHSLQRMHCNWTQWDDFCALRSLIHQLSANRHSQRRTWTPTISVRKQHSHWRVFRKEYFGKMHMHIYHSRRIWSVWIILWIVCVNKNFQFSLKETIWMKERWDHVRPRSAGYSSKNWLRWKRVVYRIVKLWYYTSTRMEEISFVHQPDFNQL